MFMAWPSTCDRYCAPLGRLIWVRALLDSAPSVDSKIAFAAEDGAFAQTHSYSFLFPAVTPGAHQVFLP
jgi:hypothetical protein